MEMTAEDFRAEAVRRRGKRVRGAPRYSSEQRAFAVAYAREGLSCGRSINASAGELGISDPTLRAWLARATDGASTTGAMLRAVVVKPAPVAASAGLTLVSPSGWRVSGLDVHSAAALLRVLG
jgi:transposase-like protein